MDDIRGFLITHSKQIAKIISLLITFVSIISIVNIYLNITLLKNFTYIFGLKISSAMSFLLCGLILYASQYKHSKSIMTLSIITASIIIIINTLRLYDYSMGLNLAIDQRMSNSLNSFSSLPMTFTVSINFIIASIAFIMLNIKKINIWISQFFIWLVFSLTYFSLCNHINNVSLEFSTAKYTTMPLTPIINFILLSIGMLCIHINKGITKIILEKSFGGYLLRLFLPFIIILPIVIAILENIGSDNGWYEQRFGDTIHIIGSYIIFSMIIYWIARLINQEHQNQNITKLRLEKTENTISKKDIMTGIFNRDAFEKMLVSQIANNKTAVILFNINQFEMITELFGHDVADLLLKKIATRLKKFKEKNMVARLSADKFILSYSNFDNLDELKSFAYYVKNIIQKPYYINDDKIVLTINIGISIGPEQSDDPKNLLRYADLALAHSKKRTKKRLHIFSPYLLEAAANRLNMEYDLKKAFLNNEFIVYFQPQVNLVNKKICGAEALVRWQHSTKGLLLPGAFINYIEELGLINSLNELVLRSVFQLVKFKEINIPISINISCSQFKDQYHLLEFIEDLIDEFKINPKMIELEVTEDVLMQDIQHNFVLLAAIQKFGFKFAIDDFGSGFSSFSYLKKIPASKIKIDKSFIKGLPRNEKNALIVKSIIELFHLLNMKVVAEGTENEEEINFLKANSCDIAQGFYFYRPMPVDHFMNLLQKKSPSRIKA